MSHLFSSIRSHLVAGKIQKLRPYWSPLGWLSWWGWGDKERVEDTLLNFLLNVVLIAYGGITCQGK